MFVCVYVFFWCVLRCFEVTVATECVWSLEHLLPTGVSMTFLAKNFRRKLGHRVTKGRPTKPYGCGSKPKVPFL